MRHHPEGFQEEVRPEQALVLGASGTRRAEKSHICPPSLELAWLARRGFCLHFIDNKETGYRNFQEPAQDSQSEKPGQSQSSHLVLYELTLPTGTSCLKPHTRNSARLT